MVTPSVSKCYHPNLGRAARGPFFAQDELPIPEGAVDYCCGISEPATE